MNQQYIKKNHSPWSNGIYSSCREFWIKDLLAWSLPYRAWQFHWMCVLLTCLGLHRNLISLCSFNILISAELLKNIPLVYLSISNNHANIIFNQNLYLGWFLSLIIGFLLHWEVAVRHTYLSSSILILDIKNLIKIYCLSVLSVRLGRIGCEFCLCNIRGV